jgi:DNA-binding NtrC family response regulator
VAPLRQRPEDIPLIADFLLNDIKAAIGKKQVGYFTEQVVDALSSYQWPGNVRELRNIIERAVLLCQDGDISDKHLVFPDRQKIVNDKMLTLSEVERSHIEHTLQLAGGNRTKAAQILGIARSTLNEKIKQLNLNC